MYIIRPDDNVGIYLQICSFDAQEMLHVEDRREKPEAHQTVMEPQQRSDRDSLSLDSLPVSSQHRKGASDISASLQRKRQSLGTSACVSGSWKVLLLLCEG